MRISDWSSDVCSSDLPALADHSLLTVAVGVSSVSSDGSAALSLSLPSNQPLIVLQPASANTPSSTPAARTALLRVLVIVWFISPRLSGPGFTRSTPRAWRATMGDSPAGWGSGWPYG